MNKLSLIKVIKILMRENFTTGEIATFINITEQDIYDLLCIPQKFRGIKNLKKAYRLLTVKKLVEKYPILIDIAKNYSYNELNKNILMYKNFENAFKDF